MKEMATANGAAGSALDDARVLEALEEYTAALEAGRPPERAEFLARHAAIAAALAACLDGLALVQAASPRLKPQGGEGPTATPASAAEELPREPLGDFRIVRELGRGGMGVVYEAAQLSLGRRVALKILPFAATLDPKQRQRFLNEAQVAAQLHHPHIVPVYAVGSERGVHYYAMQYIEGQTLAALIRELRQAAGLRPPESELPPREPLDPAAVAPLPESAPGGTGAGGTADTARDWHTALASDHPGKSRRFFRAVAELGIQAAGALEHAHQLGIVHRDVKPSNLLVDATGHLWITDFGLAQVQGDPQLTRSGDVVGTLRYMSPEQALAQRRLVDHRSDLYALGATLYELLTLQPAYPGRDRQEVVRQIAGDEPRPPRRVNPAVPIELETIVQKAMAREPQRRYATAQELADDLQRFLEDKPIQARRPSVPERLLKWARRHRSAVAAAAVVIVLTAAGLLVSTLLLWRERGQTQAAQQQAEANFRKALEGMNQLLLQVEDRRWDGLPGIAPLREELWNKGIQFFQKFIEEGNPDPAVRFQAARAYDHMAVIRCVQHKFDEAVQAQRKAVALYEALTAEYPQETIYRERLFHVHLDLAVWFYSLGVSQDDARQRRQAREEFAAAARAYRPALPFDADGRVHNNLAMLLADCPEEALREPAEAVVLAQQALALAPQRREFWNTLGIAHYRAGDLPAAAAALDQSMARAAGGDAYDWFFLAMIAWQQGHREQARHWFDQAVAWWDKHADANLFRYGKEAAHMLGVKEPGPPGTNRKPAPNSASKGPE